MKISRRQIPGYEIMEVIASGGMGTVFKARQTSLDKMVALKLLSPHLARDGNYVERFVREARALAKLNHPNVVTVIDVGRSGEHYYLIMELVPGKTLADLIDEKEHLPHREALTIIRDVARALQHAEDHHLIHRDIKPENILFSEENVCKLCDLGLARRSGASSELTAAGIAMGTPDYIAPEQARGLSELDIRTDIYSLGATLFHALTGKPPFDGPTPAHIMRAHIDSPVEFPAEPPLDQNVRELIEKMMAKSPALRQQSARELTADIEAVIAGGRVSKPKAEPLRLMGSIGAALRRHAKMAVGAAVAAVAAIVLLAVLVPSPAAKKPEIDKSDKKPVTTRPGGRKPGPRPQVTQRPPAVGHPQPDPAKRIDYEEMPSEAQLAYEAAEAVEKDPAARLEDVISEYRMVSHVYPGTSWGEKALARALELEKVLGEQNARESEEYASVQTRVGALLEERKFHEAFLALTRFAARYPGTALTRKARALARQVVGDAARLFTQECARANALAKRNDFPGARRILQSLQDTGIPELDSIIAQKLALLSQQERKFATRRESSDRASLYRKILLELFEIAQGGSLEKALVRVGQARKEPEYAPISDALEREEEDLRNAISVLKAAEEGLQSRTGTREQLVYRNGGAVWGKIVDVSSGVVTIAPEGQDQRNAVLRIEELDDRQIVNLTAFGKVRPSDVSKLLFYTARGSVEQAFEAFTKLPADFSERSRITVKLEILKSLQDGKMAQALASKIESSYRAGRIASAAAQAQELFDKYAHTDFLIENAQRLGSFVPQQGFLRIYSRSATFKDPISTDIDLLPSFSVAADALSDKGTVYVRWEGLLKVPADGQYTFHIMASCPVRLKLGTRWALRKKVSGELEIFSTDEKLRQGLTELVFEATCSKGIRPIVQVFWQRENGPRAPFTPVDVFYLPAARAEYEGKQ